MKIALTLFGFIVLCIVAAGAFGIIHDQITYSISREYFTHFKFLQFQLPEYFTKDERIGASIVGWNATWWTGLIIGSSLGLLGIRKQSGNLFFKIKLKSLLLILICTLLFTAIGFIWSKILFSQIQDWPMIIGGDSQNIELREILKDHTKMKNFITVGTIHNFSYIGGGIGLIIALIKTYRKIKITHNKV